MLLNYQIVCAGRPHKLAENSYVQRAQKTMSKPTSLICYKRGLNNNIMQCKRYPPPLPCKLRSRLRYSDIWNIKLYDILILISFRLPGSLIFLRDSFSLARRKIKKNLWDQGNRKDISQAILKCFIDLKNSVWFTLGSEDKTMVRDTQNFFQLDRRSRFSNWL